MAIRDLPNVYALSPRTCGPRALGCMPSAPGPAAPGPLAYTSGKSLMAVLQPLHVSLCVGGSKGQAGMQLKYIPGR